MEKSKRVENLKGYCINRLMTLDYLENNVQFQPMDKIRLNAKQNIIRHLLAYNNYAYFLNEEELAKYIDSRADIICGFYED